MTSCYCLGLSGLANELPSFLSSGIIGVHGVFVMESKVNLGKKTLTLFAACCLESGSSF